MRSRKCPRVQWVLGYWDGPISGVALYRGEYVWFTRSEAPGPDSDWLEDGYRYYIYAITQDEQDDLIAANLLWTTWVSTSQERGTRVGCGRLLHGRHEESFKRWYRWSKRHPSQPDVTSRIPVAHFHEDHMKCIRRTPERITPTTPTP